MVDPDTGVAVDFDSHLYRDHEEVFIEAKWDHRWMAFAPTDGYWTVRTDKLVGQAESQLAALPDGAVLEWHVSDPYGAAAIRKLFESRDLFDITVIYTPKAW